MKGCVLQATSEAIAKVLLHKPVEIQKVIVMRFCNA